MSAQAPVAMVVQRYGPEIVGGSEALCRCMAEMLAPGTPVEVLTTCALDYVSWKNELPAGPSVVNGVLVRRFPVDFERGAPFYDLLKSMLGGFVLQDYETQTARMRGLIDSSSRRDQLAFLKLQGPYSTPLLEYLASHHDRYSRVIFFTYLYPTTVFGIEQVPLSKAVLVPTAHDEALLSFPVFREILPRFPAFIFLTPEERELIEERFAVRAALKATVGMPVELPAAPNPARFLAAHGVNRPFVLYAGRIDTAKGCNELVRFFLAGQSHLPPDLDLLLMGNRVMELPRHPRVRYLGLLPEHDKYDALAAASVVVNSSPWESFSIVTLEAMLCGTPVLVNARSPVLKGHVRRSSGGLHYAGYGEFCEAVRLLLADRELRLQMGRNGQEYVRLNYRKAAVQRRLLTFLGF